MKFEVVAIDWKEPNIIATFDTRATAEDYAERMDANALRCYVRETGAWEGHCAMPTANPPKPRCREQCPNCRVLEGRRA